MGNIPLAETLRSWFIDLLLTDEKVRKIIAQIARDVTVAIERS